LANGQDECTLRAAIEQANQSGSADVKITFAGVSETTVKTSELPAIKVPLTIDGTTAPGGKFEIIGPRNQLVPRAQTVFDGLTITGGNSTIKGLVINQFERYGLVLRSGGNNIVQGCFIGTDTSGTVPRGNGRGGCF